MKARMAAAGASDVEKQHISRSMRILKAIAVMLVVLAFGTAPAAIEDVNGIKWWYKTCEGGVEITSVSTDIQGDVVVPSVLGGQSVVSIGDYAFSDCISATSFTIPSSVKRVGSSAFYACTSTISISLPNVEEIGETAFWYCSSLASISLPNVRMIAGGAFFGCYNMSSVTLSSNISDVGGGAFYETQLINNIADNSLMILDGKVVLGYKGTCPSSIAIPAGVKVIAAEAFANCRNLESVSLPNGLVTIGDRAFSGTALMGISIPSSVKRIGSSAFSDCGGLSAIALPDGLQYIGGSAFSGCDLLSSIEIPASVTTMFEDVFNGCSSLESVTFKGNCPVMGVWSFYADTPETLTTYVPYDSTGWDEQQGSARLPEKWFDRPIAHYGTPVTHTVTFDANGGSVSPAFAKFIAGDSVEVPTPTRDGNYSFEGWYDAKTGGNCVLDQGSNTYWPSGNVTLYARWRAIPSYTVTLDANGGTVSPTATTCIEGNSVSLPTPTRSSEYGEWLFEGWYDAREGGNCIVSHWSNTYSPSGNVTLYAHWNYYSNYGWSEEPRLAYDNATGYVWLFILRDDGTAEIVGVTDSRPGVLRIPSSVVENSSKKSYTVTSIGNHAFEKREDITSVILPNTVTRMGCDVFGGSGITSFTVPTTVRNWEYSSFSHCQQLETLTIQTPYGDDDGDVYIEDCPKLKILNLPSYITNSSGDSAPSGDWKWWKDDDDFWHGVQLCFTDLPALESLTVPENVTYCKISMCQNLSAISFPSTLRELSEYGFWGLWNLDKVVFAGPVPGDEDDGNISSGGLLDLLCSANSVYYPEEYADQWKKILRNFGYGGTHGVYGKAAAQKMAKMVKDAPMYADHTTPDFGPFVVGIAAEQTMPSAAGFEMGGIPKGLEWDALSGRLSGMAQAAGTFTVVLSNGAVSKSMVLRVDPSSMDEPFSDVPLVLYKTVDGAVGKAAMSTYDGHLYDDAGNETGTILVKVGKPNKKTGFAAVKATVIGPDGKKKNLKAEGTGKVAIDTDGPTTVKFAGAVACEVTLGAKGMSGKYGAYGIDGALNVFSSRDSADKAVAASALGTWQGAVNVAWRNDGAARPEAAPYQTLSVTIAAKGKAKLTGTLMNGAKVSAKGQLIVGEDWCCVPVVYVKNGVRLSFAVWLPLNGAAAASAALPQVAGLGRDVKVGKPAQLKAGATFRIDADAFSARWGQRALPYLPDGLPVAGGAKWSLPKAGRVVYKRGTSTVDETKVGENPSALKLSCKAKDGTFKGTFKAYADVNGRLKATTVKVSGVMIGNTGYGMTTIKNVGDVSVTVE